MSIPAENSSFGRTVIPLVIGLNESGLEYRLDTSLLLATGRVLDLPFGRRFDCLFGVAEKDKEPLIQECSQQKCTMT